MRELNADAIERMLRETAGRTRLADIDVQVAAHSLVGAGEQVGRWWLERDDVSYEDAAARFERVAAAIIASMLAVQQ
jgi:hypothetical protein